MPSIWIVGFHESDALEVRDNIDNVMRQMQINDAITTMWPESITKKCGSDDPAPHIVVRSTDFMEAEEVARALRSELKLDVEFEKIGGFLEYPQPVDFIPD